MLARKWLSGFFVSILGWLCCPCFVLVLAMFSEWVLAEEGSYVWYSMWPGVRGPVSYLVHWSLFAEDCLGLLSQP